MKILIGLFAFTVVLSLAPRLARAEEPQVPDNIQSADVCSWHSWTGKLTCRDAAGNKLISKVRTYKSFRWISYPALPMVSLMKRLGFESRTHLKIGDDTEIIFTRPVNCKSN